VVIPASARKALGLETGEKLLVFGWGEGTVMLCKVSEMEKYAGYFAHRVEVARTAIEAVGGRLDPPPARATQKTKAESQARKGRNRERRPSR
jgi:bifunctional DNA-binding transcriptional regulator/antitoxin component of YhaV-PrlF toxin-antitoxin module